MEAADGVHIHGIWEEYCTIASRLAREGGKPYLVAAHGMLEGWALRQKRLKKMLYSLLVERANLREATCLQALTTVEVEDYRRFGLANPVAVIPNGVEVPAGVTADAFLQAFPELRGKRLALFLGRLHPKKGLDILCRAWARIHGGIPDAHLVIAGPDFEETRAVTVAGGEVESAEVRDVYRDAGPREEVERAGRGARVRAAVALRGLQRGDPGSAGHGGAGDRDAPLQLSGSRGVALRRGGGGRDAAGGRGARPRFLTANLGDTLAMRDNARRLIAERYTWDCIGRQVSEVYEWILGGRLPGNVEVSRCARGAR